jgi:hypothetical protein
MKLCEFCIHQQADDKCAVDRPIPKKMKCIEFTPGIERFCATPAELHGARTTQTDGPCFSGLAEKNSSVC